MAVEHQLTLARFGGERLLYRLSQSAFADRFILKGAALLLMWLGETIRPTRDVDLLGVGDTSAEALWRVFVELCAVESPDDGLTFLPDTVHADAIREDQEYGGMRIKLMAMLGTVRIPLQVDRIDITQELVCVDGDLSRRGADGARLQTAVGLYPPLQVKVRSAAGADGHRRESSRRSVAPCSAAAHLSNMLQYRHLHHNFIAEARGLGASRLGRTY